MKFNPQQRRIYDLHSDGNWHCSTQIEYIRDHRKRISEMNKMSKERTGQELFEAMRCDKSCGQNHKSNVFMRRLKVVPKKQVVTFIERNGERIVQVSYV